MMGVQKRGPEENVETLRARLRETEERLAVAEAMLLAIRKGEVDALVVDREGKPAVYMLKTAAEPYRVLIEQMAEGALTVSHDGIILYCNAAMSRLVNVPREALIGSAIDTLIADQIDMFRLAADRGSSRETELIIAGGSIPALLSSQPVEIDGELAHCVVVTDLRRQKHRALHEAVVESALDAIFALDTDGAIQTWPAAAEKLFGYATDEALGASWRMLMPQDRLEEGWTAVSRALNGEAFRLVTAAITKSGQRCDIRVSLAPIREHDGAIAGVAVTVRDITEQLRAAEFARASEARIKALSEELLHVARLTELGQVSAGIAHELNQPLAAMLNYAGLARRLITSSDAASTSKAVEAITKASEQAVRASEIIRRMRDFVEKRQTSRSMHNINTVVQDAIALGLLGAKGNHLKTKLELAPDLPSVLIDPVQIQQVLVNLLRNAVEALEESPKRELTLSTALAKEGWIEVRVADTGPGIPDHIARRFFQPFVTSKPNGMGIGLPISKSIIDAHGGKLSAEPRPGGGTVFRFTLPVPRQSR